MEKFKCPGCGLKPFPSDMSRLALFFNSYKCQGCETVLKIKYGFLFTIFLAVIIAFAILVSGLALGLLDKSIIPPSMSFVHQMDWDCFGIILAIPILKFLDVKFFGFKP